MQQVKNETKKQQRVIRKQQQRISWLKRRLNVCHKNLKKSTTKGQPIKCVKTYIKNVIYFARNANKSCTCQTKW